MRHVPVVCFIARVVENRKNARKPRFTGRVMGQGCRSVSARGLVTPVRCVLDVYGGLVIVFVPEYTRIKKNL